MTVPTRKMRPDSLPRPRRCPGPGLRKSETLLSIAQKSWREFSLTHRNLNIPVWYSGLHGVPNWFLRQKIPSRKMDTSAKIMTLVVRMNYVLDYAPRFGVAPRIFNFCFAARRFRSFCRSFGPIYDKEMGSYRVISHGRVMNTSYARTPDYQGPRALACTLRNFVHLVLALKSKDVLLQDLSARSELPVELNSGPVHEYCDTAGLL